MSKFLIKTTEQYRCDSESEAKRLIEEAKADKNYSLGKYSSEYKCAKAKGEICDEWYRVVLVKTFTEEKEPYVTASVNYHVEAGAFPDPIAAENDGGVDF